MTKSRRTGARLHVTVLGNNLPAAARGLDGWLVRAAPRSARGAVDIRLVSDRAMQRYNRVYRGQDRVTDVLSFPAEPDSATPRAVPADQRPLGDIAIARGRASRQAREQGHGLRTELQVLALHGLLHLLGYDHEQDTGQMRRVEDRLRRRAGLPSGLITRAGAGGP